MAWGTDEAERFGIALQRLRHERGLTQEQLAYAAGITKNQVQLLEAGRASGRKEEVGASNPRVKTLAGLAESLGLSLTQLLAEADL